MVLLKLKPTRYRQGQRPTLIDLILSNSPERIENIENVINHTSEHQGVMFTIEIKEVTTNVQFCKTWDKRLLNAENILPMIENSSRLQEIFQKTDVDEIVTTFTEDLKKIKQTLATLQRVQLNKKSKLKISKETAEVIEEADNLAHNGCHKNSQRFLRCQTHAKHSKKEDRKR